MTILLAGIERDAHAKSIRLLAELAGRRVKRTPAHSPSPEALTDVAYVFGEEEPGLSALLAAARHAPHAQRLWLVRGPVELSPTFAARLTAVTRFEPDLAGWSTVLRSLAPPRSPLSDAIANADWEAIDAVRLSTGPERGAALRFFVLTAEASRVLRGLEDELSTCTDPAHLELLLELSRDRPVSIARLADRLFDPALDETNQARVLTLLAERAPDPEALAALERALAAPNAWLRRDAYQALERGLLAGHPDALDRIAALIAAPECPSPVRHRCFATFARGRPGAATSALRLAIAPLEPELPEFASETVLAQLEAEARDDTREPRERLSALEQFARGAPSERALPTLTALWADPVLGRLAVSWLATFPGPHLAPLVRRVAERGDERLARSFLVAAAHDKNHALPLLSAALAEPRFPAVVRGQALRYLAVSFPPHLGLDLLERAHLADVELSVAWAIERWGAPALDFAIRTVVSDRSPIALRAEILSCLSRSLTRAQFRGVLELVKDDPALRLPALQVAVQLEGHAVLEQPHDRLAQEALLEALLGRGALAFGTLVRWLARDDLDSAVRRRAVSHLISAFPESDVASSLPVRLKEPAQLTEVAWEFPALAEDLYYDAPTLRTAPLELLTLPEESIHTLIEVPVDLESVPLAPAILPLPEEAIRTEAEPKAED